MCCSAWLRVWLVCGAGASGVGAGCGTDEGEAGCGGPADDRDDKPVAKVSPMLYGLMTEEINYSYDGGLYAELIQNRTFTGTGAASGLVLVAHSGRRPAAVAHGHVRPGRARDAAFAA